MRDLAQLPKAHLHVHLESTIRAATYRDLTGRPLPETPVRYVDFRGFADHNAPIRAAPRTAADFARLAVEFCADQAADGVRYAEVTVTAAAHGDRLGDPDLPLAAVLDGLAEGQARHDIDCRVLLDHSRRRSVQRARRTLDLARRHPEMVIGLGLAGDESHPLTPFADICREAADAGLRLVHHAGETTLPTLGVANIREAIGLGRAERIGHGIAALADPDLVAELRERRIPLEVCPTSNVLLGLVPDLAAHPFPRLRAAGLAVTVNTDIPCHTHTTLTSEYTRLRDTFGYSDETLADLARASVTAAFAPDATKARLHRDIDAWLATTPTAEPFEDRLPTQHDRLPTQ